jgi:methionyl-tRNA synthetase
MDKRFYITTPIYYVNSLPHLGHAYTTIVADALARFYRLQGYEVFFLTGTDEHGDKIAKAAEAQGKTPKQFVDEIANTFKETWDKLGLNYSYFIRTTSDKHKRVVQHVLQTLFDKGEFYLDEYEGNYCFGCERFLTTKELDEKGLCKDHKAPPVYLKEKNYFFNLEKYRGWLKDYLSKNEVIYPSFYREEVLNLLEEPLPPLCISRPKTRLSWGIELPFDKDYVTYVWFDALLNYLTGIGYPDDPSWQDYWANSHHLIAKDILRPHAVYFPIMLKALGIPMYKKLFVHGYWLMGSLKMSKSLGNIVSPLELSQTFGIDQVRYYLLRDMAFGYDAEFSLPNLINRINADLANDYGNLVNRTLSFLERNFGGTIPPWGELTPEDREFREKVERGIIRYLEEFPRLNFHIALEELWQAIRFANVYIDREAPWTRVKEGNYQRAGTVLRNIISAIKSFALVLYPVLPNSSLTLLSALSVLPNKASTLSLKDLFNWDIPEAGTKIRKCGPLFPRVDEEKILREEQKVEAKKEPEVKEEPQYITIEEFRRIDLRVAKVLFAEKVAGADRLLRLEVSCPEKRQIVAGIAEYYEPQELIGKEIIIVANLKPAKIKGIVSEGMLLAAKDANGLAIIIPEKEKEPGAKVG